MTSSPTPTELLALKTAHAAEASKDASYDLVSTIVFALGAAQLLQSPETAAELARLRAQAPQPPVEDERLAEIASRRDEAVEVSALASWPLAEYRLMQQTLKDSAVLLAETKRLRARVAELEAERHTTNEALSDAAERLRRDRDRIAELEAERSSLVASRDAQIIAWLGKKAGEYGYSNAEKRAQADAVARMADKLRRGAVPVRPRPNAAPVLAVDECLSCGEGLDDENISDFCSNRCQAKHAEPAALHEAAAAKLRGFFAEDPHDSPLHHTYRVGRDLPEVPHA